MKTDRQLRGPHALPKGLVASQAGAAPKPTAVRRGATEHKRSVYALSGWKADQKVVKVKEARPVGSSAPPAWENWEQRRAWFERTEEDCCFESGLAVSEQACALADDVKGAFCDGAWLSTIQIALAIVDDWPGQAWPPGAGNGRSHPARAPEARTVVEAARERSRNLLGLGLGSQQHVVDRHWRDRTLEGEARQLIQLMFKCLYPVA